MTAASLAVNAIHAYVEVHGYEGHAAVLPGHGHTPEVIQEAIRDVVDGPGQIRTQEVYWATVPRVKWCSQYGNACDSEGDWHKHWYDVQPTDDPTYHFTVAWVETVPVDAAGEPR